MTDPDPDATDGGPSTIGNPITSDGGDPPPKPCTTKTPEFSADVEVVVRAQRGPHGAPEPVVVDRRLYGMNIADWRRQDYSPPSAKFFGYLGALEPGVLRWPAGHRGQHYAWARTAATPGTNWTLTPEHVDAFIALAKSVNAEPLLAINQKTGSIEAAQDLVRYVNLERGYGVKWFQVGNEPDHTDGLTSDPESYGDRLAAFADAILQIDPNARIVAPEIMTGAHIGDQGRVDWMGRILARVGPRAHAISWHYYPLDSGQSSPTSSATMSIEHLFQEEAWDWPPAGMGFDGIVTPILHELRDRYSPGAELWITEFAEDPGPGAGFGLSDRLVGALWAADSLGRYAERATSAVLRFLYKSGPEHGYNIVDHDENPRPAYGTYWLYARHMGNRFVDVSTTALTEVAAHAALRNDGTLSLVLVNKTTAPKRVRVVVEGFCPTAAGELTLEGPGYEATTFTINGEILDEVKAQQGIPPKEMPDLFDVALPPTSVRLVSYRP